MASSLLWSRSLRMPLVLAISTMLLCIDKQAHKLHVNIQLGGPVLCAPAKPLPHNISTFLNSKHAPWSKPDANRCSDTQMACKTFGRGAVCLPGISRSAARRGAETSGCFVLKHTQLCVVATVLVRPARLVHAAHFYTFPASYTQPWVCGYAPMYDDA